MSDGVPYGQEARLTCGIDRSLGCVVVPCCDVNAIHCRVRIVQSCCVTHVEGRIYTALKSSVVREESKC